MMEKMKKKMSRSVYLLIVIPLSALLLGIIITATAVMNYYSIVMNNVFGGPDIIITKAEGTEDWDADYYGKAAGSKQSAAEKAAALAIEAEKEGIVLLKNKNNALPLSASKASPITVNGLGWGFYYPVNGGAGAGAVGSSNLISPEEALAEAGININQGLKTAYKAYTDSNYTSWAPGGIPSQASNGRPTMLAGMIVNWSLPELDGSTLTTALTSSNFSANPDSIVWIARGGGETNDAPRQMNYTHGSVTVLQNANKHYLELTDQEEAVLTAAKDNKGTAGKVIVVINSASQMELAKLEDDPDIDAILWVGAPGKQGYYAIGRTLTGTYNPSGRLPDTYMADFLLDPAMQNFSDPNIYASDGKNGSVMALYDTTIPYANKERNIYYVGYEEGIYLGYRFYETASAESYFTSSNLPSGKTDKYYNRDNGVVYPFGHGLSYTTFSQKITGRNYRDGVFTINVEVKNTGSRAGKDVVQLYAETPYTKGGIEKSKVVLSEF